MRIGRWYKIQIFHIPNFIRALVEESNGIQKDEELVHEEPNEKLYRKDVLGFTLLQVNYNLFN
jgi:hypothetical protein